MPLDYYQCDQMLESKDSQFFLKFAKKVFTVVFA